MMDTNLIYILTTTGVALFSGFAYLLSQLNILFEKIDKKIVSSQTETLKQINLLLVPYDLRLSHFEQNLKRIERLEEEILVIQQEMAQIQKCCEEKKK